METRELKFRAWDKVKKVMLYDVAVYSTGSGGGSSRKNI
jgi:hypothetical protein